MAYSSLVDYIHYSPNNSGPRREMVTRITPHCVVGQISAESLGAWFHTGTSDASSNYGIDKDARVALFVDEGSRAWTSSSADNDNRAITIECASDGLSPYAFRPAVYDKLVDLCVDICNRYHKTALVWIPDKARALAYDLGGDQMLLTVHRWFASTDCPGEWLMARLPALAEAVTARLGGARPKTEAAPPGDVGDNIPMTARQSWAWTIAAPCCVEAMKRYGVLASVSIAQACLESDFGRSELAKNAKNLFGMKTRLSGNTWPGSTWKGQTYSKETGEYAPDGTPYREEAQFRAYDTITESFLDHAAYLAGAMADGGYRYDGIIDETDPARVCDILVRGGYATDPAYKSKLLSIIDQYNLRAYDDDPARVTPEDKAAAEGGVPYRVRVSSHYLRIRRAPGIGAQWTGKFTGPGVFTIVEERDGWGRLKSGAGWVSLDYCKKV